MVITSVVHQTRRPDHLTIYDDNDPAIDIRSFDVYLQLLHMLDAKGIGWDVVYGQKKGQHHNHQLANKAGYDAVWRLDDDCIAEPDVLSSLEFLLADDVGAVGGSVLTPTVQVNDYATSSRIDELDRPNKQWVQIRTIEEVEHLHCSFLYRAGIVDYDLRLSKKAHREETMFTHSLKLAGYKLLITPCITWHLKAQQGGIRSDHDIQDYHHDEQLFQDWLRFKKTGKRLFVLNGGRGDNYMFLQAVTPPKGSIVATCHPDIFTHAGMDVEIISIGEAQRITDIEPHNVYAWCARHGWKGHLVEAYREMYQIT
jgi:hypothetical protein